MRLNLSSGTNPLIFPFQRYLFRIVFAFSALILLVGCQKEHPPPPPQPFYGPSSGSTRVSRCQKRTSGLYCARRD